MSSEKCVKIQFSAVEFGPSQEISRVEGEYGHSLHIQGCPATIKKIHPVFGRIEKREVNALKVVTILCDLDLARVGQI